MNTCSVDRLSRPAGLFSFGRPAASPARRRAQTRRSLAGCGKTRLLRNTLRSTHAPCRYCTHPQDAQKGRPHRPSLVTRRSSLVPARFRFLSRYASRFTLHASRISRTPLADFFRILLVIAPCALDGLRVRLRRPYLRKSTADFGLKRLATALVNHPGYVPSVAGSSSADVRGSERADDASVNRSASSQSWRSCPSCRPRR